MPPPDAGRHWRTIVPPRFADVPESWAVYDADVEYVHLYTVEAPPPS